MNAHANRRTRNARLKIDKRYVFGLRYLDDLVLRDDGGTCHEADHSTVSWPALTQPE